MKIHDQFKHNVIVEFENARVPGTGKLALRQGFYFVRNLQFKPMGLNGEVLIANGNWKSRRDDHFLEEAVFEVALRSLAFVQNVEDLDTLANEHIGTTFRVYEAKLIIVKKADKPQQLLACQSEFIADSPRFITRENAVLIAIVGNAKTIPEAIQNFIDTAPYDVVEAMEFESQHGTTIYFPIEDSADDEMYIDYDVPEADYNDVWDAPEDETAE